MKSGGPSWPNPLSSPPRWSPWNLFRSFKVCSDVKERERERERERSAESNGKLPHQSIPRKTAILVPDFAMEDLPWGRIIAALVPEFAVKDLSLGRTL